jgi:hypothetical protein
MNMPENRSIFVLAALIAALIAGASAPALAQAPNGRAIGTETYEFAAQTVRRPHIVIRPRRIVPGPNAKRYCRSWLAKEYRVSGPVIVPQQQCWWQ